MGAAKPQQPEPKTKTKTGKPFLLLLAVATVSVLAIVLFPRILADEEYGYPKLHPKEEERLQRRLKEIDDSEQYAIIHFIFAKIYFAMNVVKVADHEVFEKVDTQYVEEQLGDLEHIGIVFICTSEGGVEDDWTDEEGQRIIVIHLPYEEVRRLQDARPLMLSKAKERLGLVA